MSKDRINFNKRAQHCLTLFCFFSALSACGSKKTSSDSGDQEPTPSTVTVSSGISNEVRTTPIPSSLVPSGTSRISNGFSLTASATSWNIQLTNCLSGYTATVTNANLDGLEAYKGDRDCLAKLTQFTYNGRTYIPTAGDAFTTWQAGDTAIFDEAGEPGVAALRVAILSTLGSPILPGNYISYAFSEVLAGQGMNILWSTYGAHGRYVANVPGSSSFSIRQTELTGLTGAEAGQFRFILECMTTIGITNICESFNLASMDYKLIEDTYLSAPTVTEMATIFGTAGTSVTLPGDRVAPGSQGTVNGGFITTVLSGPTPLATKPNMLLVIRSGTSYQYLNVDVVVQTPWQLSPYPTIAMFPFDTSTGVTTDTSLYAPVTLTDNSTAAAPVPKFGEARDFTTAATTMTTPSTSKLNLMSTKMTVEGWINLTSLPTGTQNVPLVKRDDTVAGTRSWGIRFRRNTTYRLVFERSLNGSTMNIATSTTLGTVNLNTWYHYAITFNNGTYTFYWNGNRISTGALTAGPAYSAGSVTFGGAFSGVPFNGRLDDVRFSQTIRYTGATYTIPTSAFDPES